MFTPEPEYSGASHADIPVSEPIESTMPAEIQEEFEFVLGRRQIASISIVVLTAIGACTTAAYIAGKSVGKVVKIEAPAPKVAVAPVATMPATSTSSAIADAPLAGTPEPGKTYIQVGSVERGFATLMAHGARKLGFPTFVAPGATPNVYRVLSGPFKTPEEYQRAKLIFDAAGLESFARKYTAPAATMPNPTSPAQP